MPLTVAAVETHILGYYHAFLIAVGMDGTTSDGTNPDLVAPIAAAAMDVGLALAGGTVAVDADLAGLGGTDVPAFLGDSRYQTLEAILGHMTDPDTTADTDNIQALGRLREIVSKDAARLRAQLMAQYGLGLMAPTAGVVDLGFAETIDIGTGRPV